MLRRIIPVSVEGADWLHSAHWLLEEAATRRAAIKEMPALPEEVEYDLIRTNRAADVSMPITMYGNNAGASGRFPLPIVIV